ncbi:hypothetical protein H2201_004962 [Coniosporium apollinis]|uniref:SMODS and SLOG-associating 2TM effector domain-containing protein n=1 Tax=Coniosporium apollinis TaxID=61459 RepID=A0ABQ9NR77_9PEZI|nr:hypothetical protein H2201_004962 [Coniosporium apollinis]
MPFDCKAYSAKCDTMSIEELQKEWEHYTRLISGAATSTTVSSLAIPFTLGMSVIGVAMAAPAIHNARKKRAIIETHLEALDSTHRTRKRDVIGSMALSGTIGIGMLGLAPPGAETIMTAGAEHGIEMLAANETAVKVVVHATLDGTGAFAEKLHTDAKKEKAAIQAIAEKQSEERVE